MIVGFSMPGGAEFILILLFGSIFLILPILAIVFYVKNRELKREVQTLKKENELLTMMVNKK